jgi:pantothenate kinase
MSLSVSAQTFQLKFTTLEKYLTQNYTPEKVKAAISSSYSIVKRGDTEWKFRDDSKSWEAILYVQFDKSTKKIKEIQFIAPGSRAYEFMDEIEKNLGFILLGTEGKMDIYENKSKKLGVKIVPAEYMGKGMTLYRIYRL